MATITITKLEAARRQLTTAIRLFFNDDDIASIHTLAGAAREIYESYCKAHGIERMFDHIQVANPDKNDKALRHVLNGARNFLKHFDGASDLDAVLEIDDGMNAHTIFIASYDCAMACGTSQPPEVQVFTAWFYGTMYPDFREDPPTDGGDTIDAGDIQRDIESAFPGLRGAPLLEQKRIGRVMLARV